MTKPQFTIQVDRQSKHQAKFVFEPLPQGFGHTLGNSLRRVLYTSIPGASLTSVSVAGINHQFTTLPGVQEDIVQLILNLKQIHVSYSGDQPVRISLSAKGQTEVTAGDFDCPAGVQIANPELKLAHLSDKTAKLEIEATVESGLGYSPAEDRPTTTLGVIPIDASFTPVVRVNFTVESTRVGRVTNFDKLILEVITDGTIDPEDAIHQAAQTLVDYFSAIVSPAVVSPAGPSSSSTPLSAGSALSIEELDLPTRISNALQKAGIDTVGQLISTPHSQLSKVKNLGGKSVKIIELALRDRGFELESS